MPAVKIVFRGTPLEVEPSGASAGRSFARGHASLETVSRVLAAMESGGELVLQNTRLTLAELSAQRDSIASVPVGTDPALVLFTSGTTGAPKAARLSRENLESNARAANEVLGVVASSRFLCVLPLFHVGGLGIVFRCRLAGATVLLHERFEAAAVARDLEAATHASLVASTLARVLEVKPAHFPPVVVAVGGGPVPPPLLQRARDAGLRVVQTWGMTETCSMATCERPDDADGATAGPPLPGFEVRIDRAGALSPDASSGAAGEVLVRGPAVMRGYLGHEPLAGRFFRTGDLGELDARGRLTVHARRSDLIVSGGENVYPAEVEAALLAHPAVREAAVLPEPDERWGQVGVAWLVTAASDEDLRRHLSGRLA
ncbi:MAG TPA: AMP-binding protein, partial [Myxococcales bacterium]|nr:AMP-binding protein [Myxococcales bacterium]